MIGFQISTEVVGTLQPPLELAFALRNLTIYDAVACSAHDRMLEQRENLLPLERWICQDK